jgi:hemerythrin-like domain-containing protein
MEFALQTARLLHDEHMEEVAVLERLEGLLRRHGPSRPPSAEDGALATLLAEVIACVETQSDHHFVFEEEHLFPRLAALGEADIGLFLASEHEAIREVGASIVALARQGQRDGLAPDDWRRFHGAAAELIERVISHIQKEEMGLLPMVEELLDGEEDSELALAYMSSR